MPKIALDAMNDTRTDPTSVKLRAAYMIDFVRRVQIHAAPAAATAVNPGMT